MLSDARSRKCSEVGARTRSMLGKSMLVPTLIFKGVGAIFLLKGRKMCAQSKRIIDVVRLWPCFTIENQIDMYQNFTIESNFSGLFGHSSDKRFKMKHSERRIIIK